jgi:hypothetical protein
MMWRQRKNAKKARGFIRWRTWRIEYLISEAAIIRESMGIGCDGKGSYFYIEGWNFISSEAGYISTRLFLAKYT